MLQRQRGLQASCHLLRGWGIAAAPLFCCPSNVVQRQLPGCHSRWECVIQQGDGQARRASKQLLPIPAAQRCMLRSPSQAPQAATEPDPAPLLQDPTVPNALSRKMMQRIVSVQYSYPPTVAVSPEARDLIGRIFVQDPVQVSWRQNMFFGTLLVGHLAGAWLCLT